MPKSFAEMLNERLERKAAPTATLPSSSAFAEPVTWNISFARPKTQPRAINQIYRVPARPVATIKNSTVPTPTEHFFTRQTLKPLAEAALAVLIQLGAKELEHGFSATSLRRSHRRLAKRLHPDLSPTTAEDFRRLRSAYQILNKISLSGGSESASAEACPRPSAA